MALFLVRGPVSEQGPTIVSPTQPPATLTVAAESAVEIRTLPKKDASAAMRKRFVHAHDYAAFIFDAMKRPEEGGRFYAFLAFRKCAEVSGATVDSKAPLVGSADLRVAATALVEDLQRRCKEVAIHFPDEGQFMRALYAANAIGTPDLLMNQRMLQGLSTKDSYASDLTRAVAIGDPYLVAETIGQAQHWYRGQIDPLFDDPRHGSISTLAAISVQCELVGDCTDSYRSMSACYHDGMCAHKDYRDFLARDWTPERLALFIKARKAYLKLAGVESRS